MCFLKSAVFLKFYNAVQCLLGCTNRTLQLVGGQSTAEGRVEVCINGVWGSVCHNSWDNNDARVVCRQLELPYPGSVYKLLL